MKILLINSVYGYGSTGKIVSSLNNIDEIDTLAVYGRKRNTTNDKNVIKITNIGEVMISAIETIIFNEYSNYCNRATSRLCKIIDDFKPDIIHIHNLHGYYVNFDKLLIKLKEYNKPVVWTLHDCWPMTGYCCHFDYIECDGFINGCKRCNHDFSYPFSFFKQNVPINFSKKINRILDLKENLIFVTPSVWLKQQVLTSQLKEIKTIVINNGIALPSLNEYSKNKIFSVLAVANSWTKKKGLDELKKIIKLIDKDIEVTIVGDLEKDYYLEQRCKLIPRTENYEELASLYKKNHLLINPTLEDTFPTVNIESISFGTPVISYETGGSPEIYDSESGITIKKYDYVEFSRTINSLKDNYYFDYKKIIKRSKQFSKEIMISKYTDLYNSIFESFSKKHT